jgi:hypothetical protein
MTNAGRRRGRDALEAYDLAAMTGRREGQLLERTDSRTASKAAGKANVDEPGGERRKGRSGADDWIAGERAGRNDNGQRKTRGRQMGGEEGRARQPGLLGPQRSAGRRGRRSGTNQPGGSSGEGAWTPSCARKGEKESEEDEEERAAREPMRPNGAEKSRAAVETPIGGTANPTLGRARVRSSSAEAAHRRRSFIHVTSSGWLPSLLLLPLPAAARPLQAVWLCRPRPERRPR